MVCVALTSILVLVGFLSSSAFAQNGTEREGGIGWRLENPFRFFKDAKDTARLFQQFQKLRSRLGREPTILEFERHLSQVTKGWGWSSQILKNTPHDNVSAKLSQEACWYSPAKCSDYAKPKRHRIVMWSKNTQGRCTWVFGRRQRTAACDRRQNVSVPYPSGLNVALLQDGKKIAEQKIVVRDLMVVGLGDSFSSGEGNPDVPVRFNDRRVLNYIGDKAYRGYPPRQGRWKNTNDDAFMLEAARWVHRPCHRSLYSQHVRLALHLALRDPTGQTSVTFLGLACTGGEMVTGLFKPWSGNEAPRRRDAVRISQLAAASQVLCGGTATVPSKPFQLRYVDKRDRIRPTSAVVPVCPRSSARPIDLVLLSVGGNDIGFSRLVSAAGLVKDPLLDALATAAGRKFKISIADARRLTAALPVNYAEVARAMRDVLHVPAEKVVLTAYPPMAHDARGAPCASGTSGYGCLADVFPQLAICPGDGEICRENTIADDAHGCQSTWMEFC